MGTSRFVNWSVSYAAAAAGNPTTATPISSAASRERNLPLRSVKPVSKIREHRAAIATANFDGCLPGIGQHHVCADTEVEIFRLRQLDIEGQIDRSRNRAARWRNDRAQIQAEYTAVRFLGIDVITTDPDFGVVAEAQTDPRLNR